MTQYLVDIPPAVEKEIEEFYLYIADEKDSPVNATRWYFDLYDKIQTLKNFPERCPLADEDCFYGYEIRNLIIGNYRVLYRIKEQTVQVLHVKYGTMERKPF